MDNFKELLGKASAGSLARKYFYISEKQSVNYGDFANRVNKIGSLLNNYDLKPGSKVLLSISSDYDMICLSLALITHGITAVLIEPDAKEKRAGVIISASQIDGWIVDKENAALWNLPDKELGLAIEESAKKKGAVLNKLLRKKTTAQKQTLDSLIDSLIPLKEFSTVSPDEAAVIIFTSGTTSDPKGVVLTHGNILAHLATLSRQYEISDHSIISNILPLYHVDGLFQGPFLTLYNQITLSRPFPFEVQRIEDLLDSVYKYKVSHFFTVPTMLALIDQFGAEWEDSFRTDDFKYVISVAGYLEENLWQNFMNTFKVRVVNVYGLTETVAGGFFCGPSDEDWRIGSVGKPEDSQVKIVDEQGDEISGNQIGELLIQGDHVMKAYLNPSGNPDENGWFRTGDLAFKDNEGFYFIKGRLKNVIIKGGINIYPEEVIETLQLNPEIDEAFVYGVTDEIWGEKAIAVIRKSGASAIKEQDVIQYCREHMEQSSVPDQIYFVDELPKGMSGKVQLDAVKSLVNNLINKSNDITNKNDVSIQDEILSIASKCFNSDITKAHVNLPSQSIAGWNSLEHLDFATQLEKSFNIQLNTKEIMNITSISQAILIINNKNKTI